MSNIVLVTGPFCTEGSETIAQAIRAKLRRDPVVIELNTPIVHCGEEKNSSNVD